MSRKRCLAFLWLAIIYLSTGAFSLRSLMTPRDCVAGDEDVSEKVRKLAFNFDSDNNDSRSIIIKGQSHLTDTIINSYVILYKKPNSWMIIHFDETRGDHSPLGMTGDNKLLIYDPMISSFVLIEGVSSLYELKATEQNLEMGIGWNRSKDAKYRVNIDMRSFMSLKRRQIVAKELGVGLYEFGRKKVAAGSFSGVLDQGKNAYRDFVIYKDENKNPLISVDLIEVNYHIDDDMFKFPDLAILKRDFPVLSLGDLNPETREKRPDFYLRPSYWVEASIARHRHRAEFLRSTTTTRVPDVFAPAPGILIKKDMDFTRLFREKIITEKRLQTLGYGKGRGQN